MTSLHVHEFGPADGRPFVALHGVCGHGARWRRFAEQQLAGFRVIAPDLRGHGRSPMVPPWNLAQHTADVIALLDSLGLDRVPLLGHSYGGSVAIDVANLVPSRISHLVLVDPAQGLPPQEALEIAEETLRAAVFDTRDQARADLQARWDTACEEILDEEIVAHVVQDEDGRWRYRYSQAMAASRQAGRLRLAGVRRGLSITAGRRPDGSRVGLRAHDLP
jgi:lipase